MTADHARSCRPARLRAIRRRRATALVVLAAIGAAVLVAATSPRADSTPPSTRLLLGDQVVATVPARRALSAPARSIPATVTVRSRGVTTLYAIDRRRAAAMLRRARKPVLALPARALAVSIAAPVIAQRLRDNCESAALQVLLATKGVRVDQLRLQRELPRSGPLDPQVTAAGPLWGDPDEGYVGRPDGAGSWGGFGVYPGPIARLAARHGRRLRELPGSAAAPLYRALLQGHAVLAWIGLGDGPYRDWISPEGRPIRVNLNEHTVVLTGIRRDGSLELVNVLQGTREVWSRADFEQAWALLGRRALATT